MILNKEDVIKKSALIEAIFKDYERLDGEIIMSKSTPTLVINGYEIAKVKNDIIRPHKLSCLKIINNNIYAYI